MIEWLLILEQGIWFGIAAIGFAVLFNVPFRALLPVFIMGALGGLTKTFILQFGVNVIIASFMGAALIGLISIPFAHKKHAPPPIFAIPAVIPMVPGILTYRIMLGLINMAGTVNPATYTQIMSETVNYSLKVMLILMSLAGGVAIPMILTRKDSAKEIRFRKKISD